MRSKRNAKLFGVLMMASLVSGCGEGERQAPIAKDTPDGGQAAAKSIMQMQPPPPPKKSGRGR